MSEWISVKDRLPEDFERVIVRLFSESGYGELKISSVQNRNITTADNSIISIKDWADAINAQVTHWMPLPKLSIRG